MDNPEKSTSLFTLYEDEVKDKKKIKELFKTAQENGSIMWQDVISFNNEWLEKHGIYDSKTKTLDEKKLKEVARSAMNEMLKRENMVDSAIWTGAIHINTDNIHIHLATVEPYPTRERGKRKPKTLSAMKSKVINGIMDRSLEYKKINDIIRANIVAQKKQRSAFADRKIRKMFKEILKELPEDRRQWKYNYNSIREVRPKIDEMSRIYIRKYHKKDYEELLKRLEEEERVLREAYGEGGHYKRYRENKVKELYTRLGNAFLSEMREYAKMQDRTMRIKKRLQQRSLNYKSSSFKRVQLKQNFFLHYHLKKLDRVLSNEYENWKNQLYYERLQQEIERDYERY